MEYPFQSIEKKWQEYWKNNQTFKVELNPDKPKFYVLDMFPYPSGAGLHVGHPLGYIASDIYSRYKRLKGFNVLHPMGYDAFGLPAEQYAIQTGQHPAITTAANISRYREQLDKIGLSYDWSREIRTCDPDYYKWTQWIFVRLFNSWYDNSEKKARDISSLISVFEKSGNSEINAASEFKDSFSANEWNSFAESERENILQSYRLAYISEATVNWCPALGTVLANEEVKEGVSERGGHPVERKLMKQWSLRITAYAERLLNDLDGIDWPDSVKEQQRNWIGKSEGAQLSFALDKDGLKLEVFTTRPDTIFGVSFMTIAPEHELLEKIVIPERKEEVLSYVRESANRSERERVSEVKRISGVFTGTFAIHPFTGNKIPVWVGDYVLAGYGTGAVMSVPAHDERDHAFAKHFNIPIPQVISAPDGFDFLEKAYDAKEGVCINSDFLNGLKVKDAITKAVNEIESRSIGKGRTNYRLRDAVFGRQRYWGEPIPVYYKDGIPYTLPEDELPLILPEVDKYLPREDGEPPLARANDWKYKGKYDYELTTMPGWAGSSWYFLRYMDSSNDQSIASQDALDYWKQVDLYMGGAEHATGHLLYVRFWTKFLYDIGFLKITEPAKKLINQGMIQGRSNFVYRLKDSNTFVSYNLRGQHETIALHVDVNIVENDELDIEAFRNWRPEYSDAEFILEDGKYICGAEIEKMSKSKWNVVSPDSMIEKYGADCLRLYEMFLGPLELSKPWNTNGISGTSNFIRKLWKLYHEPVEGAKDLVWAVNNEAPSKAELKILHQTIKKIADDIERYSFNTSVSNFMICVNELTNLKCRKRAILEPLAIILSPYAPHISEELWEKLGHNSSVSQASFPEFNQEYLVEDQFAYPISFNGKTKFNIELPLKLSKEQIEQEVLDKEEVKKLLAGQTPKKVVVVPGRIVNIVF
ncbi:MAG: leucine--tRNA ligase [Bacteroidetes bacterium]|nr:MAG: leucine--tRNA ligase [Bacteroidota bacterium]REK04786.1 MAG: leucine--tRNA ligase [Bacteroidota bacterium]REK36259.1 MAG: leucine--tRNA ligase [Bacteroidota bacterium]